VVIVPHNDTFCHISTSVRPKIPEANECNRMWLLEKLPRKVTVRRDFQIIGSNLTRISSSARRARPHVRRSDFRGSRVSGYCWKMYEELRGCPTIDVRGSPRHFLSPNFEPFGAKTEFFKQPRLITTTTEIDVESIPCVTHADQRSAPLGPRNPGVIGLSPSSAVAPSVRRPACRLRSICKCFGRR